MSELENKKEMKVSKEVAEQEFASWAESMDLDHDTSEMDEEDLNTFNKNKRRIIKAIMNGSLTINDEGEAVYTPVKSENRTPITFHERSGAALMATDGKKKGHDAARTYAMLGSMCQIHPRIFASLKGIDIKICETLFAFLMD